MAMAQTVFITVLTLNIGTSLLFIMLILKLEQDP